MRCIERLAGYRLIDQRGQARIVTGGHSIISRLPYRTLEQHPDPPVIAEPAREAAGRTVAEATAASQA